MGLRETDTVDIVAKPLPGEPYKLVLYVVDDGSIADEIQRYKLLIQKLTAYVNYVSGPEFRTSHPSIGFPDVLVRVLCRRAPNEAMSEVQAVGAKGDVANRLRVVFADYDQFMAALERDNPPLQRTGAVGIVSRLRQWLGRGPGY